MKITIEVPDEALQSIVEHLKEYWDVTVTVDELKDNEDLERFIKGDIAIMYFEQFEEGLADVELAEELGLEADDEEEDD